jgi:hypothetical protein
MEATRIVQTLALCEGPHRRACRLQSASFHLKAGISVTANVMASGITHRVTILTLIGFGPGRSLQLCSRQKSK